MEPASALGPDCTERIQIGINATQRASVELHIAADRCGLLLGLIHHTLGDQMHLDLSSVEWAHTRQLVDGEALSHI